MRAGGWRSRRQVDVYAAVSPARLGVIRVLMRSDQASWRQVAAGGGRC